MLLSDLDYAFPPELTAQTPRRPSRVAFKAAGVEPREISVDQLIDLFNSDDLLVVNETKVIPARVFTKDNREILFLKTIDPTRWEVLFYARGLKLGTKLTLPGGIEATYAQKGLPQHLTLEEPLAFNYFLEHGEMALPPYIQEARGERHNRKTDETWYQTAWALNPGSVAAPTASLHFDANHLKRFANVAKITLHVGAGTFFPVRSEDITLHQMHSEPVTISAKAQSQIKNTRGKIWALGTTVARALESMDQLPEVNGELSGETQIFIYPPYQFKKVDVLLTNFHQPRSTLLALVAAFAGLENVKRTYAWAIERQFNLFSYGDLSAWMRT